MAKGHKMVEKHKLDDWYRLDNAAKIYPPVISADLTSVFRLSCTLNERVKIGSLREAATITAARFPYFNVTLRRGFFWYYLECSNTDPTISAEEKRPLTGFPVSSVSLSLYRILARGTKISVEFLHVIADGGGAMEYFRSLLVTYLRIIGKSVDYKEGIIDPSSSPKEGETEDSFKRYYRKEIPKAADIVRSWNLPYPLAKPSKFTITEVELSVSKIREMSKSHGVTITEYLSAVYLYAMQGAFLDFYRSGKLPEHKIIRLEVPINMRKLLPSITMRNFSLFVMPEINMEAGKFTFDEIIEKVHNYMHTETDTKLIYRIISRNVKPEYNPLLRVMPLFVKDIALSVAFRKHGPTKYSSVLSNMGIVQMPEGCEKFIKSFSIIPPPPNKKLKISCGAISYGDNMRLTFVNLTSSLDLERRIISFLVKSGSGVKIINNYSKDD